MPKKKKQTNHSLMFCLSSTLLLAGIAISIYRSDVDGSQKAITGILTNEASLTAWWSTFGLVITIRRGSLNAAWIWLVNEPGVKRPAKKILISLNLRPIIYSYQSL